ncbi:hypothetical protein ND856_14065 [Leptospira bandrabouensis]|uniref:hypothetical protein n=1 Tax=Leptospira bandrabouensis TaxID=2484903 RepID=UPI00223C8FB3|nr:hypothetical protein [Leptospira bandrabouensis]MCW7459566.1 hypothetical protein [Leptospira bandrabouensis]MCW7478416.1 hypothetical protein [Leptospira bandrabouensis]MCW7486300.1 hypothetical protein [Leptospira bandrabouensis]
MVKFCKRILLVSISILYFATIQGDESKGSCLEGNCHTGKGRFGTEEHFIEGTFKNGKLDRTKEIKETFDDGSSYEGFYNIEAEKHGKGKYIYIPEGADSFCTYVGTFKNDKFNGNGSVKCENGFEYSGNWKDGKKDYVVTPDFIARSLKKPEKWREAKTSGTFWLKQLREESELTQKIVEWDADIDFEKFFVAEVLFDKKEFLGTRFFLIVPKSLESKFDKIAQSQKPNLSISGEALGVAIDGSDSYPMIQVESLK